MEIINKQFVLDKAENINVEYIEKHILDSGYQPLRWAIVKSSDKELIIDSVIINK